MRLREQSYSRATITHVLGTGAKCWPEAYADNASLDALPRVPSALSNGLVGVP